MEKNSVLTHSLTHPAYLMPREPKRLHFGIILIIKWVGSTLWVPDLPKVGNPNRTTKVGGSDDTKKNSKILKTN